MNRKLKSAGRKIPIKQEGSDDQGPALPFWYRSPARQMEFVSRAWPDVAIPEIPEDFTPKTKDEVLLLHVPRSVSELWWHISMGRHDDYIIGDQYVEKYWHQDIKTSPKADLYRGRATWVAFDPNNGLGRTVEDFYDEDHMAGVEVLSAILQFPKWPLIWTSDHLFGVCVVGCRSKKGEPLALHLGVRTDPRKLEPHYMSESSRMDKVAFPTVRRV